MELITEVINFLELHALFIINEFKESSKKISHRNFSIEISDNAMAGLSDEMRGVVRRQHTLNAIYEVYDDIVTMKKNDMGYALQQYIENMILEIAQGKAIYNNNHPFYGFPYFIDRLMKEYVADEKFEMCAELQNIVS